MRCLQTLSVIGALILATVDAVTLPAGVPRDISEFRDKHPYTPPKHEHRKIVQIRASKNDADDVSDEFKKGVRKANGGGTLHLAKGKTYVIGKALDLTGLEDIHVHLEGEIRVSCPHMTRITKISDSCSSLMTLSTGKRMPGIIRFRNLSCSGSGEERTLRSTAMVSLKAKGLPPSTVFRRRS
jgi:hypothetical protein